MAGLDYSNVREPTTTPEGSPMSRTMEANITGTVEYLQGVWDAREELTAKGRREGGALLPEA
jgi:hypothetical protein